MELLRLKADVTDIQVLMESGAPFHFTVALSCLSPWWFHLTDTGTLFNEFLDQTDIVLVTMYSLEFVSLQGVA